MARTKDVSGNTKKSKAIASSSGAPKQQRAGKKGKFSSLNMQVSIHDPGPVPRRKEPQTSKPVDKPIWKSGPLSSQEKEWQADLYDDKLAKLKDRRDAFICEREITDSEFRPFGIVEKFEALGWEAALKCYDKEKSLMYMDPVHDWMATLEVKWGKTPKDMVLTGVASDIKVSMSIKTLRKIANFDSRASDEYIYPDVDTLYRHPERHPRWKEMIEVLFEPGKGDKMVRNDLKREVRLLLIFLVQNVMPRRGDKFGVRLWEIPILYSLMTGAPKVSFMYLVMMNIWDAREQIDKRIIPHVRLITALLKLHGVFKYPQSDTKRDTTPFTLKSLSKFQWVFSSTERYFKLKHKPTGQKLRALKPNARELAVDEQDEVFSDDSQDYARNVENDTEDDEEEVQIGGTHGSMCYDGWDTEVFTRVEKMRPDGYSGWPDFAQALYDQSNYHAEQQKVASKALYDRQEHWNRMHAYNQQVEINHRYNDDQQRRMYQQWSNKEQVIVHPPYVDYSTCSPRGDRPDRPMPPVHHSQWVDPYLHATQVQGSSGDSSRDVPGCPGWFETMTGIFGSPKPPYF